MLRFFRQIRHRLLTDNIFSKYLLYAVGEILLVVVGILIALQVNNWSETKSKDLLFRDSIEQIYTGLDTDIDYFNLLIKDLNNQVELIDLLLEYPETFDKAEVPFALHSIVYDNFSLLTETEYFTKNLVYNPDNAEQKDLSRYLANYVQYVIKFRDDIIDFNQILMDQGIPRPLPRPYKGPGKLITDSTFYSQNEIDIAFNLLNSSDIKADLKSVKSKTTTSILDIEKIRDQSKFLVSYIKNIYPDIQVVYNNVGIIGTAINGFDDVGAISTPMLETASGVFEVELFLKEGLVKFRCNDSWLYNWGGDAFPNGEAISYGNDIIVDSAGNYRVRLDLNQNKYFFQLSN